MVGSLIVGKIMIVFGRKRILLLGIVIMGVSMAMFGQIMYFQDSRLVVAICLVSRVFQGFGSSMIQTTSYAIITVAYKEKKQKYLGYFEASQGLGCALGPGFGGLLYSFVGFSFTFYILSCSLIVMIPILWFQIPNSVDKEDDLSLEALEPDHQQLSLSSQLLQDTSPSTPTYTKLFLRKTFTLCTLCGVLSYFSFAYFQPMMPLRLKEFELGEEIISFFFMIGPVSYLIVSSLGISVVMETFGKREFGVKGVIVISLAINGVNQFFIGPSEFLPNSLIIMAIGQAVIGAITIFCIIGALTIMIQDSETAFPAHKAYVNYLSSGVFNFSLQFGQTLAPIYGSYMTEMIGLRNVCTTVGVLMIAYGCIFYIFCITLDNNKSKDFKEIELQKSDSESKSII
ncbi:unnamed protein product [Moneuplotes crassus]|uniref:Major facilitator superfamily (MFS) profile domain-containing protein n=1 Tax=Euplotes crassus TaxID=5936 RepID=A0AAD1XCV4_EUPCR|nr:unnamed protein product [Moneuplotes crassus]